MKIIFICNEYPSLENHGGIGSFVKLTADFLISNGHDVLILGLSKKIHEKIKRDKINGVNVIRSKFLKFGNNTLNYIVNSILFYFFVKKKIKEFNPDIIESHDWTAPLIKLPTSFKGKYYIRLHGSYSFFRNYSGMRFSKIIYLFEKFSINKKAILIGVSRFILDETKNFFSKKNTGTVIYNSVNIKKFRVLNNTLKNQNKILLIGKFHYYKGYDLLFKCLDDIFNEFDNFHIDVVGNFDSKTQKYLLNFIKQDYYNRVNFLGRIDNHLLPEVYNSSYCLIHPSRAEAHPIIPLESMACGTPVLISNRFSSNEFIINNNNGFLFSINSLEEMTADIIDSLHKLNERYSDIRNAAISTINKRFTIDKIIKENLDEYLN
mgnify:CR=1 FL=1